MRALLLLLCACVTEPVDSVPSEAVDSARPAERSLHTAADSTPVPDLHIGMAPPGSSIRAQPRPTAPPGNTAPLPVDTQIRGGITPEAMHRVVQRHRRALRRCTDHPVSVRLRIDKRGVPTDVHTQPEVPCVTKIFSRMRFPRPTEGVAEITWPWVP